MSTIYENIFLTNPSILRSCVEKYTYIGQVGLPLASAVYAAYQGDYEGVAWLGLALLINQICLEVLKRGIYSIRPNGLKGSFPSGHTSAAFIGPAFLIKRYHFSITSPPIIFSYLTAIGVAVGRVLVRAHWPIDVLAGSLLGTINSWIVPFNPLSP